VRLFAGAVVALLALGALVGVLTRGGGGKGRTTTSSSTAATLPIGKTLPATLASLMGLTSLRHRVAPNVALTDQHDRPLSLSALRGKVVLLTFFDAGCTGICPVESAELRGSERALGTEASDVEVLAVDLSPTETSVRDMARLARLTGLGKLATFHALTGPLVDLRAVWAAYGVQVQLDEVHDTVLYQPLVVFIDSSGYEVYSATPSGFELSSGQYVVPKSQVTAFGEGIAHFAGSLLPRPA
jgi:cytochrome oxidase Cu insertion factor (SCO1/SenC/PrrC family)